MLGIFLKTPLCNTKGTKLHEQNYIRIVKKTSQKAKHDDLSPNLEADLFKIF